MYAEVNIYVATNATNRSVLVCRDITQPVINARDRECSNRRVMMRTQIIGASQHQKLYRFRVQHALLTCRDVGPRPLHLL